MLTRACKRCHTPFEGQEAEAIFRSTGVLAATAAKYQRAVCICCELSARTEKKRESRAREKARRAIRTHFEKYRREHRDQGKRSWMTGVASQRDFAERFGWDAEQMAHDIEHAHQNGCPYCRESFAGMAHGLADVSFDIIDPERPPYYRTNASVLPVLQPGEESDAAGSLGREAPSMGTLAPLDGQRVPARLVVRRLG